MLRVKPRSSWSRPVTVNKERCGILAFSVSADILAPPTGTLRTAAQQRPIVILAAAGIQRPFYVKWQLC